MLLAVINREVGQRQPGEWIIWDPPPGEPARVRLPRGAPRRPMAEPARPGQGGPDNPIDIEPPALIAPVSPSPIRRLSAWPASPAKRTLAGVEIDHDGGGEPTGALQDFNLPKLMPTPTERTVETCPLPMIPGWIRYT